MSFIFIAGDPETKPQVVDFMPTAVVALCYTWYLVINNTTRFRVGIQGKKTSNKHTQFCCLRRQLLPKAAYVDSFRPLSTI